MVESGSLYGRRRSTYGRTDIIIMVEEDQLIELTLPFPNNQHANDLSR